MLHHALHAPRLWLVALTSILVGSCSPGPQDAAAAAAEAAQSLDGAPAPEAAADSPSRLAVLWTSGDREVALKVAFMYTEAAGSRGWFDELPCSAKTHPPWGVDFLTFVGRP